MIYSRYTRLAVLQGLEDWVSAREIGAFAAIDGVFDYAVQRDIALLVIREALAEGLADVGDVGECGFEPWLGGTPSILDRVESDVLAKPESEWGTSTWLRNTLSGDVVGNSGRESLDPRLWSPDETT